MLVGAPRQHLSSSEMFAPALAQRAPACRRPVACLPHALDHGKQHPQRPQRFASVLSESEFGQGDTVQKRFFWFTPQKVETRGPLARPSVRQHRIAHAEAPAWARHSVVRATTIIMRYRSTWPHYRPLPVGLNSTFHWLQGIRKDVCEAEAAEANSSTLGASDVNSLAAIVGGRDHGTRNSTYFSHRCYAARHGVEHMYVEHDFGIGGRYLWYPYWHKYFALMHALEAVPLHAWVMWLDGDILMTNLGVSPDEQLAAHLRTATGFPQGRRCDALWDKPPAMACSAMVQWPCASHAGQWASWSAG